MKGHFMPRYLYALVLVAGSLLAVPATANQIVIAVTGGTPLTVPAGSFHASQVPGFTVSLTEVTDQRCPSDVRCVWEGLIRGGLAVDAGAGAEMLILCNICDDAQHTGIAGGYDFTLGQLYPSRAVIEALGRAPVSTDYTVVVIVQPGP